MPGIGGHSVVVLGAAGIGHVLAELRLLASRIGYTCQGNTQECLIPELFAEAS